MPGRCGPFVDGCPLSPFAEVAPPSPFDSFDDDVRSRSFGKAPHVSWRRHDAYQHPNILWSTFGSSVVGKMRSFSNTYAVDTESLAARARCLFRCLHKRGRVLSNRRPRRRRDLDTLSTS